MTLSVVIYKFEYRSSLFSKEITKTTNISCSWVEANVYISIYCVGQPISDHDNITCRVSILVFLPLQCFKFWLNSFYGRRTSLLMKSYSVSIYYCIVSIKICKWHTLDQPLSNIWEMGSRENDSVGSLIVHKLFVVSNVHIESASKGHIQNI